MSVVDQIGDVLTAALHPARLEVEDRSHLHAGHSGARPEGETHFHVTIVSGAFKGDTRVARHRKVNKLLAKLLAEKIHALQLVTMTPEEDAS